LHDHYLVVLSFFFGINPTAPIAPTTLATSLNAGISFFNPFSLKVALGIPEEAKKSLFVLFCILDPICLE